MTVTAVALGAAAGFFSPASAQTPTPPSSPAAATAVLDVPYLPQTQVLCGGAAAAMVMRYWGARNVYAEDFAPLVGRAVGGITTTALVADLTRRSWTAVAGPGDAAQITTELARRRPVIALIEDTPGRFHYIVVVAWAGGKVVLHDPARAPSRIVEVARFEAMWGKAQRWMLILLPPAGGLPERSAEPAAAPAPRPAAGPDRASAPCASLVDEGVGQAQRGDRDAARRTLERAAASCPSAAAPWRELAGVDALDARWDAAAAHAQRALANDPGDDQAWDVLGTADYLRHDDMAALGAWNHAGEPRLDLIDVTGLAHTRYGVIAGAIGLAPRDLVTPDRLRLASHRVRDLPAVATASVTFHPIPDGEAQIDAAVVERDRAPLAYPQWIGIGIHAATERELTASLASLSGGGEVITGTWRWWAHRPMIAASFAAPGPGPRGTIWRLDVSKETQTFGPDAFAETRTHFGVTLGDWVTARARAEAGAALDRWSDRPQTVAVSGRVTYWPIEDHVSFESGGSFWAGEATRFGAADGAVRWRSNSAPAGNVWLASAGYLFATTSSPESIWPGADTGHARDVLLRAHPLLDDGVIAHGIFGRRLAFGGVEAQHWLAPGKWPVRVAPAAFLDIGRATRGLAFTDERLQLDAGAGLRISLLGLGVLRIDLAHGLRDGNTALSVGWQR